MATAEGVFPKIGNDPLFNSEVNAFAPTGVIMAWHKDFTNTPALPTGWVECNGQVLSDALSPYNGQTIPDLNGDNRFLRGNSTSVGTGGAESIDLEHTHFLFGTGNFPVGGADRDLSESLSSSQSILPKYHNVVWIMRIR